MLNLKTSIYGEGIMANPEYKEFKRDRRRALRQSIRDMVDAVSGIIVGPTEKLGDYETRFKNALDRFKAWRGFNPFKEENDRRRER